MTFNRASVVHVFLQETKRHLVELGARADRLVVLPLPINPATHELLTGISRSKPAPKPDVVLGVGGLLSRKGWAHAVSMLAALSRTHPTTKLRLAGYTSTAEPEHAARLRNLAESLGVSDRLDIVADPTPQQLFECYRDATIFTFPSEVESFGLVLLEAMAAGLPVVASALMGADEIVPDGEAGTLVDVQRHDQYAAAVAGLLDNRALASAYGKTGRSVVNERFSVETLSPRLADLYRPALTSRR
jgi:glycosyltransferase involved in cell wall biosynthesis